MQRPLPTLVAFSLVELSIVLVILGLLVGGILSGQALIRASELRALSNEYGRYMSAIHTFRDKYFFLPGDMPNATSFWGTAAVCPGSNLHESSDSTTCNGDGDGKINTGVWSIAAQSNEGFRFWQHLANAKLIEGSYDGVRALSQEYSADNSNSPKSRIGNNVIWFAWNWNGYAGDAEIFNLSDRPSNIMAVGITTNGWPKGGFLKPEELWNLDTKMDDGIPGRGSVIAALRATCTNATSVTDYNTTYQLTNNAASACAAMFSGGF